MITSISDLINHATSEYIKDDVEFSASFFDVEVSMPKKNIIYAYAECQTKINSDECVCIDKGMRLEDIIPAGEFEDIYTGNCKDFLLTLNNDVRFHRFTNEGEEVEFVF